jgi:hypothetical protein
MRHTLTCKLTGLALVFVALAGRAASLEAPLSLPSNMSLSNEVTNPRTEIETPKPANYYEDESDESEERDRATDMLSVGLRLDSSFSAGGATQQGFSIPSLRLSAFGDVTDNLAYRVSFGQTREFSSAQLPQILPVEAYMRLSISRRSDTGGPPRIQWKLGMFTPTFNPWWTPDLSDLELPDYFTSHRSLFLFRELGTEVSYEFNPEGLKVGIGAFNGNGIVGLNSNNSKAFTGFARNIFHFGESSLEIGASVYALFQSSRGSINFKSNWASDIYASLTLIPAGINIMVDGFFGGFEDSVRTVNPSGGGFSAIITMNDWLKAMGRLEALSASPLTTSADPMRHLQVGPIIKINDALTIYSFYEYFDYGDGTFENSFQARVRLQI